MKSKKTPPEKDVYKRQPLISELIVSKLDRRDLKTLAKRNRRELHLADILLLVHDRSGFTRQIYRCV